MRIGRVGFVVVAVGCVAFAASAEPALRPRVTQIEAASRVAKLHAVVLEAHAAIQRARGVKNDADDDGVVPLDTSTSTTMNYNCAGGGTLTATITASTASSGTSAGGSGTVTATFTNCKGTSGDSTTGNITYTFTASGTTPDSGKSTTTTSTVTYTGGTLKVVGPNAGTYAPTGLSVTTVQPPSTGSPPQSTVNGTATIDGNAYTFSNDPLPPK